MYKTAYDVVAVHVPYLILGAAVLFALLGIVFHSMHARMAGAVFGVFAFVIGSGFVWQTYVLLHAKSVLESGRVQVLEGKVHGFKPMPDGGHALESFCVSNTCFYYGHTTLTAGLDRSKARAAGIADGLQVRVFYVGNDIVRLETYRNEGR